ncbi:YciI family protein [Sphingomonas sp. RP10(2022)]|uniref:YciI family protein n=1 Tax=Sphingomonas liriopis TaxID=2949094 RepID=A0A9X2HUY8_9SPHN|nr:YciI family protein [Sphingomonas liriopis]MCP3736019.1 YciI family protein [Sphingomonas liriopis]
MSEPFVRPGTTLCVVSLTYGADLDAIDAAMSDHVDWLRAAYAEGRLIASGRKQPRTGGVVIAIGTRAEVEAMLTLDPFVSRCLATAEITPFTASMAALPLEDMLSS